MRGATTALLLAGLVTATSAVAGGNHSGSGHWGGKTTISLSPIGTHASGVFDGSGAEISSYDPKTKRVFVTNAADKAVDVLDIHDPSHPAKLFSINFTDPEGSPTSVAVKHGLVAVAVPSDTKEAAGNVRFYDTQGVHKLTCTVGVLPDMITFTPDGRYVLTANEGEPKSDYSVDPDGSVSIIDVKSAKHGHTCSVRTATFTAFNPFKAQLQAKGVRIFGPNASVAQDLEPEYIAVSADSHTAWVSLQENNALAVVDIRRAKVLNILPLGLKDHAKPGNALDVSDKDDAINIANWPVFGMYQPDGIAAYRFGHKTFIVSANEGDSRDYDGYSEEARVGDVVLDATAFPNASDLQKKGNLGRLHMTTATGDLDNDGDFDQIHAFGARSFSIWSADGHLVYDSGDDIEKITAERLPNGFNSNNDKNGSFDTRSDDKGPEPEGVTLGEINGQTFAFIGLERIGGVMIYDVTNPYKVSFVDYVNNRDFSGNAEMGTAKDLGPEGLTFVSAEDSPNHKPLLIVTNEVSGTTTILEITVARQYAHR